MEEQLQAEMLEAAWWAWEGLVIVYSETVSSNYNNLFLSYAFMISLRN